MFARDGYISLLSNDILFVLAFSRRLHVAQEQECLIFDVAYKTLILSVSP